MILIDTSVWIDHFHAPEPLLTSLLALDEAGCHPHVIEELALGSIKNRAAILGRLGNLHRFPVLSHTEAMTLIEHNNLWGRGLSLVDTHLLGSTMLVAGARLWTRDKRLAAACHEAGLAYHEASV